MMIKKKVDEKPIVEKRNNIEDKKDEINNNKNDEIKIFENIEDISKNSFISEKNSKGISHPTIVNKNTSNNTVTNTSYPSKTSSYFIDKEYIQINFDFIKGEVLIDYDEAYFKTDEVNYMGTLVMTDYRLLFKFRDESLSEKLYYPDEFFKIPFFHIAKIDKTCEKKNITKYSLDISTKDNRSIKFIVVSDQLKLFANLNNMVFPNDPKYHYSFAHKYRESLINEGLNFYDGWKIYDPLKEYCRQGINIYDENFPLKLCKLNKNYNLCSTYPEILIIPRGITDEEIKDASLYRTKNRFPVLSYLYSQFKTNGKRSYASIWRSSQTKTGISGQNRSASDEKLLKIISQLNDKLFIFDARPYLNALANRIKGGGFENVSNYYNTEIIFCEIENIHSVRSSIGKLHSLSENNKILDNKKFWSLLEQSDWYEFIHLIIKYSNEIAFNLKNHNSVLVHCSDGWDRSTQLISLAVILVDPYYRTIEGIIVLIEKEWLGFGHQFAARNGLYTKEVHEDQRAPIFLQWLDCLHQLHTQYPNAFEFNMEFILYLAKHFNSNLYGTFLYNCEQERYDKELKNKTVSIWTDIFTKLKNYKNIYYKLQPTILTPNFAFYKLRFWEEFFLKWNNHKNHSKIFVDYHKNIFVDSPQKFYLFNKLQDNLNLESTQVKLDQLYEVLLDVYNKTSNSALFDNFTETTKFYLTNIKNGDNMIIQDNSKNLVEKKTTGNFNTEVKIEEN